MEKKETNSVNDTYENREYLDTVLEAHLSLLNDRSKKIIKTALMFDEGKFEELKSFDSKAFIEDIQFTLQAAIWFVDVVKKHCEEKTAQVYLSALRSRIKNLQASIFWFNNRYELKIPQIEEGK